MGFPGMPENVNIYFPEPAGVQEIRLNDRWLARWTAGGELPDGVATSHIYTAVVMDGKGYVCREHGATVWRSVEGEPNPGEKPEAALKRLLKEQMAAVPEKIEQIGFFGCRATSFHPDVPAGTPSVQPLYLVIAKSLGNMASNTAWERRRLPYNEFIVALRAAYPLFHEQYGDTTDRYLVLRARGEA